MLTQKRLEKIKKVVANRQAGLILVLEDIHDPHNASAILRTADAFGIQNVYFIFEQEKYYNPKRVGKSSSSTANKWLDFKVFRSTKVCLGQLKKQGYKTVATVLADQAKDIYHTKFGENKIAILLGNEHRGLSLVAIKMADKKIYIPMLGMVQSLNVSVSAAIVIAEICRQRQKSKKKYNLSNKEKQKLIKNFSLR
ncbi:MAG: RNA methyltransferase [Candidatus Buchananbacteria bacterium]